MVDPRPGGADRALTRSSGPKGRRGSDLMQFTGEEYYQAAIERMRQARELHGSRESYALAMYCSGLAVECILRAYRWRIEPSFEGRHDLDDLFKASGLLEI